MTVAEQIKSRVDILDVVGHYVPLKRQGSGSRYVGLCPFHSEKTGSLKVHVERQYYKCFGCGAGGDLLAFVQRIESLSFPETLKLLMDRYGIALTQTAQAVVRRLKFTDAELGTAEIFRNGLVWRLEELLAEHKARMWQSFDAALSLQGGAPSYATDVRELTSFLSEVQDWTSQQAAWAFRALRQSDPALATELLAGAEWLQDLLAEFICALAPERAA